MTSSVPPKGKGRQVVVAGMFGVSQKGARKWLEAEGMPDTKRIPEMARKLGVMSEWLLSGRLPKKPETTATPEELLLTSLRAAGWQADYCTGRPPLKANVSGQEVAYRPDIRAERGGDVLYFDIKDINLLADPLHRALASQRPELIQLPTESAANAAFFAEQRLRDMRRIQEEPAVYMPQGAIPMPEDQKAFVRANLEAKSAAEKAENDMQKGAAKAVRNKAICDLLRLKRVVSGWVGSVESIGANGDGFGVVSIMIADDVYIKTWNNALSDYGDNTLIKPGTELFDTAATLKKGQLVEFDGTFIKGKADGECVHESSMSLDGSLREPEYVFSFRRIKPL